MTLYARRQPARRAFTLVELVIVIGIIVVLASLTIALTTTLMTGSDVTRTENTLKLLESAMHNWQESSKRTLTLGMQGDPYPESVYDIDENTYSPGDTRLIRRVLFMIANHSSTSDIIAKIDSKFIRKVPAGQIGPGEADFEIIDAWDNTIRMVFPGPTDTNAITAQSGITPQNADGTILTQTEIRYGICVNKQLCFFSGGPDGKLGDLHLGDTPPLTPAAQADVDLAADNIYSYPLSRERP